MFQRLQASIIVIAISSLCVPALIAGERALVSWEAAQEGCATAKDLPSRDEAQRWIDARLGKSIPETRGKVVQITSLESFGLEFPGFALVRAGELIEVGAGAHELWWTRTRDKLSGTYYGIHFRRIEADSVQIEITQAARDSGVLARAVCLDPSHPLVTGL